MGPFKRWLAQRETMINRPKFFKDSPGSNPGGSSGYIVKYIDLTTGKTKGPEKFTAKEIPDLYKQQREGKVSIISIHKGSNPQVIGVRGVDAKLETMKEEKRKDWRARGYSEGLIDKAMDLAQEWAYKMSEVFTPPELREAAVMHNLPKGLEVADRWITVLGDAVLRG